MAVVNPESVILRLLQRSSRSPEDLIEGAVELSLVGLLSRDTVSALCKSVGLGDEASATVLRSQATQNLALSASSLASSSDSVFPWRGEPSVLGRSLLHPPAQTTALTAKTPQPPLLPSPTAASSFGLGGFDVGSRLASEFQVIERLGQGGGGAVYRARHLLDGCEYAIKRVTFWSRPGAPIDSETAMRRVLREVHALVQLNHPNVCRYYSAWVETDWPAFFNTVREQGNVRGAGGVAPQAPGTPPAPRLKLITSKENLSSFDGASASENPDESESGLSPLTEESTNGGTIYRGASNLSLDGMSSTMGCPLCATKLGGGANALFGVGGSEPSEALVDGHSNGNSNGHDVFGGGATDAFAERFSEVVSIDDASWASSEPSSPGSKKQISKSASADRLSSSSDAGSSKASSPSRPVPRVNTSPALATSLSPPVPKRRGVPAAAGPSAANVVGQPLLHQWAYRKSLLIQMEVCEPNTLRDYLQERDARAQRGGGDTTPIGGDGLQDGDGGVYGVNAARSMECLVQICQGLEHVHECGIVHRDLKPANCCFTAAGTLKLMDFGLSRRDRPPRGHTRSGSAGSPTGRSTNATSGLFDVSDLAVNAKDLNTHGVGTPSYAAPEQLSGGAVLTSCDVFPLGLIAFELFTVFGSAMERAKAFGELRFGRVPPAFAERLPLLASLIRQLLSERPGNRPTVSKVLKTIQPSPPSPVASPLTSPVLRATAPESALLPSSIIELDPDRVSPTNSDSAAAEVIRIAVDGASSSDWRDEELSRRGVECELLAAELRLAECSDEPPPVTVELSRRSTY